MATARRRAFLDEGAFRSFAPLVAASQDYAHHSGCRFRSSSFDGIHEAPGDAKEPPLVEEVRGKDPGPLLAAKLRAAPAVRRFATRLQAGEPALVEDFHRAFHVVMEESVRNSMVAAFRRLDLWPPLPAPPEVLDDDCSYEDISAPIPVLAQRTYNDELRRNREVSEDGCPNQLLRRAMTAAFLVDFAHETGTAVPPMLESQQARFEEFATRVAELEAQKPGEQDTQKEDHEGGWTLLSEENTWVVAWTAVGVATLGPVATAGLLLARRAWRRRSGDATPMATTELHREDS